MTAPVLKNKFVFFIQLVFLIIFSILWFVLIQGEYEMLTKPALQYDFPIIKGIYAVSFLGIIILILSLIIAYLIYSITKHHFLDQTH